MTSKKPLMVEVIGLAGSGKTTTSESLLKQPYEIELGWLFRTPWVLPATAMTATRLSPSWLEAKLRRPRISAKNFRLMMLLAVQYDLLRLPHRSGLEILLYDQGPVYQLSRIVFDNFEAFDRGEGFVNPGTRRLFEHGLSSWSQSVDCIFMMEAQDDVLLDRIHQRDRGHRLKGQDLDATRRFLQRWRGAYDYVIAQLLGFAHIDIIRIRTDERSLPECLDIVTATIDAKLAEAGR